jgi:hypothetical protein
MIINDGRVAGLLPWTFSYSWSDGDYSAQIILSTKRVYLLSITAQINSIEVELDLPYRRDNRALMEDYASALHFPIHS